MHDREKDGILLSVDGALTLLERAQRRLLDELRTPDGFAMTSSQEALAATLPQLPGLIASRVSGGTAEIFSRERLCEFLAEFAIEVLAVQADTLRERTECKRQARPLD